jgi:hypothetical protein
MCSTAGSHVAVTRNLESSFKLQVHGPHASIKSQVYHVVTEDGGQRHIPLSPQWSRKHGERPQTRHLFTRSFHSLKGHAPANTLQGHRSKHHNWVSAHKQSHCYPRSLPAPHSKVHNIRTTCGTLHTPPLLNVTLRVHVTISFAFLFFLLP